MSENKDIRNPHPDFKTVEASRPDWDPKALRYTKTPDPSWTYGSGPNATSSVASPPRSNATSTPPAHIPIDPYAANRPPGANYKLLISSIAPRPIALLSTRSPDEARDSDAEKDNLAPFSFFNVLSHDPPLFALGFACSLARPKDSLRNLVDTRECVINLVGEPLLEAANAASIDSPRGVSEWVVSGLTPVRDAETVRCARVAEAVVSIEAKLDFVREYESRGAPGRIGSTVVIVEGTRFWVRGDAVNEDRSVVDLSVLRPISRLGGISYGRTTEAVELLRPVFEETLGMDGYEKLKEKRRQQERQLQNGEPN
ncbi:hypothetical protein SODALDRAFT_320516 [Sodiomyces alkalinus F11]|uniref:Flavin reductase like domain-containing protein n=1 Tax=Sodiomyces alkalinus (strain CBS 110278 / VKM F-3762 / F11) TaxID=1314773 RepID=A0A3N2PNQ1_SODAK|nr:hypothetical protein SODALDRAFT_320516 [Sodiomyces alkalinus F11]ROT36060.1 hypothetical protein SODALDRAFT_320516 [Sodiomyces alkalinus F11]